MKKCFLLLIILSLFCLSAAADISPLPEDMLTTHTPAFSPNQQLTVYQGPGEEYGIAANGKGKVSTNDEIRVFGYEGGYALIQYSLNDERSRFGYIDTYGLPDNVTADTPYLYTLWRYGRVRTVCDTYLTDDPFLSQEAVLSLPAGDEMMSLYVMEDYVYVETLSDSPVRGFVPADTLEHLSIRFDDDPDLLAAADMLRQTGIEFDVTGRRYEFQNLLYFTPKNGGVIYYLDVFEFYPYGMDCWYWDGLSDEDAGKFIDYFLNIALTVETGNAPDEHLQPDYYNGLGKQNMKAVVSNILLRTEAFDEQGLRVLLDKLSNHNESDPLNSLRARAASRILGKLDHTPVSPEEGLRWYDALTLAKQDALPPDNADYIENGLIREATRLLLAYNAENNPWGSMTDVDGEKTVNIIDLKSAKVTKSDSSATIWGVEWYSKYALYDGTDAYQVSGHTIPCKIVMKKSGGEWQLKSVTYAQDGTLYAPSILEFCDNKQSLANRLMKLEGDGTWDEFLLYLEHNGYDPASIIYKTDY